MGISTRYTAPTRHEKAPYKTIVLVNNEDAAQRYYIQISSDEDHPHWLGLGDFFERIFQKLVTHDDFMDKCIELYEHLKE